jgi:hypothetical protein
VGTCRRCGNYLCTVCRTRWRGFSWCTACVDRALQSKEVSPEEARVHLRQGILGLVSGLAGWVVCLLGFAVIGIGIVAPGQEQANLVLVGLGSIILMASPLLSVFGIGQSAAAIRTCGDHMILATAGLILSGLHVGMTVGLIGINVWVN